MAPGPVTSTRPMSAMAVDSDAATDARKTGTRGGSEVVDPDAMATNAPAGTP